MIYNDVSPRCPRDRWKRLGSVSAQVEGILRVLGPDATLRRGYSITTTESGTVIKSITQVAAGNRIKTRVADGTFESRSCPGRLRYGFVRRLRIAGE